MGTSSLNKRFRPYVSFMSEISADDLYDGLVGYGLIGEKLPSVFTSELFLKYCKNKSHNFGIDKNGHNFVTYKYAQNHQSYRLFGIPNPMAYESLCLEIKNHWDDIKEYFHMMTSSQPYKVSRIHLRKQQNKKTLFNMNYKNWRADGDPVPNILLGARYCVSTDISKCFPSIYTHAVEWALAEKEKVKTRRREKNRGFWEEKIDAALRKTTNNETHGILIGPHASNLMSEIVLCRIDFELSNKWKYVRHIDDFECYVASREEADDFIRDFDKVLTKYGLVRNTAKTRVVELPYGLQSRWVRSLKQYNLPNDRPLRYSEVSAFMDYSIDLEKSENNLAVYNYAMKVISGYSVSKSATKYLINICSHLASIHPYLIAHLEEVMENVGCIDRGLLIRLSNMVYSRSIKEGNYYSAYYALYFSIKYEFELDEFDIVKVIDSDDCLLKFFAMIYCKRKNKTVWTSKLKEDAENLEKSGEFDSNWLFCYEVLKQDQLKGNWKDLKKKKVVFYDESSFRVNEDSASIVF